MEPLCLRCRRVKEITALVLATQQPRAAWTPDHFLSQPMPFLSCHEVLCHPLTSFKIPFPQIIILLDPCPVPTPRRSVSA